MCNDSNSGAYMENLSNWTISKVAYDINNNSFFNTGCIDELNKMTAKCTNFKAQVVSSISHNFQLTIILLLIFVAYKIFIEYSKPKFSQTEFYQKKIVYRIDFIIMILVIITIAFFFI